MNPIYINHLTLQQPDKLLSQKDLAKQLTQNLEENHPTKQRLQNLEKYGFKTIAISDKDECQMVNDNLTELFKKVDKNEISHIIHSSPTAVMGENGGVIGGIGRNILEQQKMQNTSFIPMLSGCASIQPVFDVASSLARAHQKPVVVVFSIHPSTCRKIVMKNQNLQKQKDIIDDIYQASPFVLFGDSCFSCVVSPVKMGQKCYEILDSKFNYNSQKWVAKAYFEDNITMKLHGENQRNMLKEYLMKEMVSVQKSHNVDLFFVHNQIPNVFKEIIQNLGIDSTKAPEVVSKFGNLACQTSLVNLAENENIVQDNNVLGLFSVGEHTGISESTILLKASFNNNNN